MRQWIVMAACLAAGIAQAGTVSKPELTIDVPDGWVEVPGPVLQAFHDELQRKSPLVQAPRYDYAFQSTQGPPWLSYPYVFVKVTASGRPTEQDLEKLPSIDVDTKGREDGSPGPMAYDKAANIVWLSSKDDGQSVAPVTGLSAAIPTEQGFVELHAYAKAADFDARLPTFRKIITSARVVPHLAYRPHWTDRSGPFTGFGRLASWAAIAGLISVFVVIYRRRKN